MVQQISKREKNDIMRTLRRFYQWLYDIKLVPDQKKIYTVDLPSADADWVMKFDPVKGEVSFNMFRRNECSQSYFKSIILHEFFHLAIQKVPNKDDATRVKDDFGEEIMRLIDIEADYFTALFYKEVLGYDIVDYLTIYYEGSKMFKDRWIRIGKLQRFIGTILSVCKMFLTYPEKGVAKPSSYDLYLVTISPLYTEENIHVLVVRREHIYFDYLNVVNAEFVKIKDCYNSSDEMNVKGYVNKIINFASNALKLKVSASIEKKINNLK